LACEWKWENGCAVDATEGEQCTEKKGRVILEIKVPYGAEAKIILPAGKIEILKGREGIIEHCGESALIAVSGEYVIGLECV
jgi:hypothetical protein